VASTLKLLRNGAVAFIGWLERRGKVLGEKNLRGNNDRQRHDNHHSKPSAISRMSPPHPSRQIPVFFIRASSLIRHSSFVIRHC